MLAMNEETGEIILAVNRITLEKDEFINLYPSQTIEIDKEPVEEKP